MSTLLVLLQFATIAAVVLVAFTLDTRATERALRECGITPPNRTSPTPNETQKWPGLAEYLTGLWRGLLAVGREVITVHEPEENIRQLPAGSRIYIAYSGAIALICVVLLASALRDIVIGVTLMPDNPSSQDIVKLAEAIGPTAGLSIGGAVIIWLARRWVSYLLLLVSIPLLGILLYPFGSAPVPASHETVGQQMWQSACGCTANIYINAVTSGMLIGVVILAFLAAANIIPLVPLRGANAWGAIAALVGRKTERMYYLVSQVVFMLLMVAVIYQIATYHYAGLHS